MVYKGKGGVANDQSDAGCKGKWQIGIYKHVLLSKKLEVCRGIGLLTCNTASVHSLRY